MKTAMTTLAVAAAFLGHAAAAGYADLEAEYNPEAFQGADNKWRRITASRISECGRYGDENLRRVDVLVDKYLAIGPAIENGDEDAAVAAAKELSRFITMNSRFEECWKQISRREDLSRGFATTIADL